MLDTNVTPALEAPCVVLRPASVVPDLEQLIAIDVVQTQRYGKLRLQLLHDDRDDSRQVYVTNDTHHYGVLAFTSDLEVLTQDTVGALTTVWGRLGINDRHWYHRTPEGLVNYLIEGARPACWMALERSELQLAKEYLQHQDLTLL